ncbi:5'-3' exonuclease [Actinophytocola sp.]|uniref:5'-3' exonuclease n=1 Tax=Actinophytocola sp. TaxID=1872138 RepID=UPI002ED3D9BE
MLVCLDISNLVARHHHAPRAEPITDPEGRSVAGAVGALDQAAKLIRKLSPSHLLVARDGTRANEGRRTIDASYKAHRPPPDESRVANLHLTFAALELLRWPVREVDRWEADDVIASVCAAYRGRVLIVSGDRDMLALCSDRVRVRLLRAGGAHLTCGPAECRQVLGVHPHQVRDLRAMAGDRSDGIPGVPGVGPKSALTALAACGTLAEVYRRLDANEPIDELKPNVVAKLQAGREQARTSWRLAGLNDELRVDIDALEAAAALRFAAVEEPLRALGLGALFPRTMSSMTR